MAAKPQVISVNVGLPRAVQWRGVEVQTGIFKAPVTGRVRVRALNLDGDRQADLSVHGGPDKAVYVYPSEHYKFWRSVYPDRDLPPGSFGENLMIEGLLESEIHVGDRLRIGTAEFIVTQPRMPCYKLGIKFGRKDVIKHFDESRRFGWYLRVEREGELAAGDPIEILARDLRAVSIADFYRLFREEDDPVVAERLLANDALPAGWREHFLAAFSGGGGD